MSKTAGDMQHLLDNPDDLDMDDEDAILALANDADLPEEADDQAAIDQAAIDEQKKIDDEASASDSADAEKKAGDEIKAPIKSKDGEHTIPYNVLENTRNSLKSANTQLEAAGTELEDQKTENARLQAIVDKAQAGGDVDEDLDAIDDKSAATTPEEEFLAKNGMDTEAFTKEYGADLTASLLAQAKESLETRQQLAVLMEDRNQKVETEENEVADTLQGAIDAIPELAALQAAGGEKWQEAVDTDNAIRQMPKYRDADFGTRFKAVAKEMGLKVPEKVEKADKNTSKKNDEGLDDDGLPTSISDLPGGSPASQSDRQTVETMDSADIGIMFEDMTQKQQEEYLNKL